MPIRAGHKVTVADFDILGLFADKTTQETVTSSTTLQNDDELFLPVAANSRYILDGLILYLGAANPAGGLKFAWTGPSGATMNWTNFGVNGPTGIGGTLTDYNVVAETIAGGRGVGTNGTGTMMSCQPRGRLITSSSSGTFRLQWAQFVSNATGTTVREGSYIRLIKVA